MYILGMDWYLDKIWNLSNSEHKISQCGDDCSLCPRFLAETEEELHETAVLWFNAGWRDHIVTNEEIKCSGCGCRKECSFNILPCQKEKGVSDCRNCNEYLCGTLKAMLKKSCRNNTTLKNACSNDVCRMIEKSFFEKELNLGLVRPAKIEDCPAICSLSSRELGYQCDENLVKENFSLLDKSREEVFVSVYKGKVTGFIHVEKYQVLYSDLLANILGLAVAQEFQHMGFGSMLLRTAENWAKDNSCTGVRVNTGGTRTEAHKFYRAQGYGKEKDQKRFLKEV